MMYRVSLWSTSREQRNRWKRDVEIYRYETDEYQLAERRFDLFAKMVMPLFDALRKMGFAYPGFEVVCKMLYTDGTERYLLADGYNYDDYLSERINRDE